MGKKVGFFGGSFDPIHFGHIGLAVQILETYQLDEILFCPANYSPFKESTPSHLSAHHRLKMLEIGLDHPKFSFTSLELVREGPSYTIDTIEELKKQNPKNHYHLLLSKESAERFSEWKLVDKLQKLAPPLIGSRTEISSTLIRERLKKNLYCSHLVPKLVLDYIHFHKLYV